MHSGSNKLFRYYESHMVPGLREQKTSLPLRRVIKMRLTIHFIIQTRTLLRVKGRASNNYTRKTAINWIERLSHLRYVDNCSFELIFNPVNKVHCLMLKSLTRRS